MIILVRHAERGDNEFPHQQSNILYDPPITSSSSDTIAKCAYELSQLLRERQIARVRLMSSKFLRCLMTAEGVGKHLVQYGYDIASPFVIDDELSEFLRPDWFKNYPLEAMVFDSECRDKYIGKCWRYETPGCQLQFPENYVTFHKRVTRVKQKLGFPEPGTCLIVFTHGLFVREFYRQATENQGYFAPIKYCGYASFVQKQHKRVLLRAKL